MPLYKESYGQIVNGAGTPYAGAKLYFYDEGTTTPKDTYTTRALSTPNANPVVADGDGRFGAIWLGTGRYKAVAKTSADVTIYTADGIEGTDAIFGILTTRGDLLTRDATGAVRKALIASGAVYGSDGTDVVAVTPPTLTGANVFTAANTFQLSDDTATGGPDLSLKRISTTPAANDGLARILFYGRDDAANDTIYALIKVSATDVTNGSEDAIVGIDVIQGGTLVDEVHFGLGTSFGSGTTGGLKGAGTVNATGYYKNGTALPFSQYSDVNAGNAASAGSETVPHTLSAAPIVVVLYAQCTTAEHNYSIGDKVFLSNDAFNDGGSSAGAAVWADATNVNIRYGSAAAPIRILNKTTGALSSATLTSWDIHVVSIA